jgi:adenylate cyclase
MRVDDTVNWPIDGARTAPSPVALLEELCTRLVAADVDIRRGAVYVETLHPTIVGRRFLWKIGEPVTVAEASFLFASTETYRNTPIREVYETGKTLRLELHPDSCPDDYSIVGEFRADGMTDYIACPLNFLNGEIHAVPGTRAARAASETPILLRLKELRPRWRVWRRFTLCGELRKTC